MNVIIIGVLFIGVFTKGAEIVKISDINEHFNSLFESKHVLRVIYDYSKDSFESREVLAYLNQLSQSSYLNSLDLKLGHVDIEEVDRLKPFYPKGSLPVISFFYNTQETKLHSISLLFKDLKSGDSNIRDMVTQTESFIKDFMNNIVTEVKSIDQLESILGEKQMVMVFFGEHGPEFKKFTQMAEGHLDVRCLSVTSVSIKNQILKKYKKTHDSSEPFMAIIRCPQLITEYDPEAMVIYSDFRNQITLEAFLKEERWPRYNTPSELNDSQNRIFHQEQPLVFYLFKEKDDVDHLTFLSSLRYLSKIPIYSSSNLGDEGTGNIYYYFIQANIQPETGRVYAVRWVAGKAIVEALEGSVTKGALEIFVNDFIAKHPPRYLEEIQRMNEQEQKDKENQEENETPVSIDEIGEEL